MGEMLILMETLQTNYVFLSYPLNIIRVYEKGQFDLERKDGIIEFIQKLPKHVFKGLKQTFESAKRKGSVTQWEKETLRSQIRKDENFNNRRKQPGVESSVGGKKHPPD
jgi:hypothetical protein